MFVKDIFKKNIDREIQAVIQAEQNDEAIRYNELDEFVLTSEGEKQLKEFLAHYVRSKDMPTTDTAVWIAGFFGSGKSHYMKIIGYLLENSVTYGPRGEKRVPADFLKEKTTDDELRKLVDEAVLIKNETITFNISAQQTVTKKEKLGISETLYNKFNELIGFSKYAKIAFGEHQLKSEGKYDAFCLAFERKAGKSWASAREKVLLNAKKATDALQEIGLEGTDAKSLFSGNIDLTVEDITELISNYAKEQGENYRLIFLIDEISQYIGDNSQLILELQTIVELLGSKGLGHVWVVVTSQKSLNDVTKGGKGEDYSKIQARFKSRINLTSSDTDEVIKKRLLEKTPEADHALRKIYTKQKDLLKTTLSFRNDTTKFPNGYSDEDEFVEMYPLVPYEITMLQEIFKKIREQGEGGASTSQGERTIIAAAQLAILQDQNELLGDLVTMAEYYPSIEQQLDPVIVNTMELARDFVDRGDLIQNDLDVLHLLYFVKGLEKTTVKPEIDNLAVMLISDVNGSTSQMASKVEESLLRLRKKMFASKKVDGTYEFLTSEERKANDAIRKIMIEDQEVESIIKSKLFTEVIPTDKRSVTSAGKTMRFESYYNGQREAGKQEPLKLKVMTGVYGTMFDQDPSVRIQLDEILMAEVFDLIQHKLKIERYVRNANANVTGDFDGQIIAKKRVEANELGTTASEKLRDAVKAGTFYVNDQEQKRTGDIYLRLDDAFKTLILKTYDKMDYITTPLEFKSYKQDWLEIAKGEKTTLFGGILNPKGCQDMEQFITYKLSMSPTLNVATVVDRYTGVPFGWEERDIIAVLLTILIEQKIKLKYQNQPVSFDTHKFIDQLDKKPERERITIEQITLIGQEELNQLKNIIRNAFDTPVQEIGENTEEIIDLIDRLFREQFTIPLYEIEQKMDQLENKPGIQDFKEIKKNLANYERQTEPDGRLAWFKKYGIETFEEARIILEDLQQFYLEGRSYSTFQELEGFSQVYRQEIGLLENSSESIAATAKQFKLLLSSGKLPGQGINRLNKFREELSAYWKMALEKEREIALHAVHVQKQLLEIQNPEEDSEFEEVLKDAKSSLEQLESRATATQEVVQLKDIRNKAPEVVEKAKWEITQIIKDRSKEDKKPIVFCKPTIVMNELFKGVDRLESEMEIDQALIRLRKELVKQLETGTIVRER